MPLFNLLADQHIPFLEILFPHPVSIERFDPSSGPAEEQLSRAQALLIRTVTRVDAPLLRAAPELRFIHSATAGYDHLDFDLLSSFGIDAGWSAGCNARSVAEYVASALLVWAEKQHRKPEELTAGVVGAGHAGSAVADLLTRLGCRCRLYDPPRQEREPDWQSASETAILNSDIITFHTGLNQYPDHPSYHWLGSNRLAGCNARLFINAARGGVVDESALLAHLNHRDGDAILDVWEQEPRFTPESARSAWLATPHIAGYSRQSKFRATRMAANRIYRFFNLEPPETEKLPANTKMDDSGDAPSEAELIAATHPMFAMHPRMQELASEADPQRRASRFAELRVSYAIPDEWQAMEIPEGILSKFPRIAALSRQD